MSFFLKLDGINGDAIERGHENWFTITGVSWGASSSAAAVGGGAAVGKATLEPVVFRTLVSANTPELLVRCASGLHIAQAQFEAVRDIERPTVALSWTFSDVLISSLQLTGTGGDPALDQSFSLSYRQIRMTTFTQDPNGGQGTEVTAGWDVATGTRL
jgi:type VI secretion system secreted protein Hcp